jgi:hypothetical protein
LQSINKEKHKGIEYEGLPGVESHKGSLVVAPDGQKKEGRDGAEVGDCADKVVREAGLWGIGHNPSFFGIRSGLLAGDFFPLEACRKNKRKSAAISFYSSNNLAFRSIFLARLPAFRPIPRELEGTGAYLHDTHRIIRN